MRSYLSLKNRDDFGDRPETPDRRRHTFRHDKDSGRCRRWKRLTFPTKAEWQLPPAQDLRLLDWRCELSNVFALSSKLIRQERLRPRPEAIRSARSDA